MLFGRRCPQCDWSGSGACPHCLAVAQPIGAVTGLTGLQSLRALYRYDSAVSGLILAAKNRGRRDVLVGLGRRLADAVASEPVRWDQVTWVPASHRGRRARGQDHGRVLARTVATELGVPCRRLLTRSRGAAQTGRDRASRLDGPAFRAPLAVRGTVLVVDDVVTTGASLDAAAATLRLAGARHVCGLVVAWRCSADEAAARRPQNAALWPYRDRPRPSMVR